jgi:UDP-3-O-[3-hydroxymyristoyl] N-acetylglucosamine deacetylase
MDSTRNQRTIARPAAVDGFGYWTGKDVHVEFRPAGADSGVVFVRSDLAGYPRIPASLDNRVESPRRTTLRAGSAAVEMVEHVLAALAGLRIDNCEIWVDQPEIPGLDGSALPFVEALTAVGVVEQNAPRPRRIIRGMLRLGDEDAWIEARPPVGPASVLHYQLDYGPASPIGRQSFETPFTPQAFRSGIAPARTFLLRSEAQRLLDQGLGQRATTRDLLVFDSDGPMENRQRFPDECARHKVLDLVGDLALAGCDLVGRFTAHRSGHRLNAELVRALLAQTEVVGQGRRCA